MNRNYRYTHRELAGSDTQCKQCHLPIWHQRRWSHFKLYFYAAVLHVIEQASQSFGSRDAAFEHFPFLQGYYDELATQGLDGLAAGKLEAWWRDSLRAWEDGVPEHLPLRALREG